MNLVDFTADFLGRDYDWLLLFVPVGGWLLYWQGIRGIRREQATTSYRDLFPLLCALSASAGAVPILIALCGRGMAGAGDGGWGVYIALPLVWGGFLLPALLVLVALMRRRPTFQHPDALPLPPRHFDRVDSIGTILACGLLFALHPPRLPGLEVGTLMIIAAWCWLSRTDRRSNDFGWAWLMTTVPLLIGVCVAAEFLIVTTTTIGYGGHLRGFTDKWPMAVRLLLWFTGEAAVAVAAVAIYALLLHYRPIHDSPRVRNAWHWTAVVATILPAACTAWHLIR